MTLYLTAIDPIHLDVGKVLCPPTDPVALASAFTARIIVFDIQVPILAGTSVSEKLIDPLRGHPAGSGATQANTNVLFFFFLGYFRSSSFIILAMSQRRYLSSTPRWTALLVPSPSVIPGSFRVFGSFFFSVPVLHRCVVTINAACLAQSSDKRHFRGGRNCDTAGCLWRLWRAEHGYPLGTLFDEQGNGSDLNP